MKTKVTLSFNQEDLAKLLEKELKERNLKLKYFSVWEPPVLLWQDSEIKKSLEVLCEPL